MLYNGHSPKAAGIDPNYIFKLKFLIDIDPEMHLRISGADHDELGRVDDGNTLPLDCVQPRSGRIKNHIHQPILQKIHLVHIQDAAIRFRLQPENEIQFQYTRLMLQMLNLGLI